MTIVEEQMDAIAVTLDTALGKGQYPPELIGDLHDLWFTLQTGADLLSTLAREDTSSARERFLQMANAIEFLLLEEIPIIARDLVPMVMAAKDKLSE